MGIPFPIIQEMDSHLYKLDVDDDQDRQAEFPDVGYHGIGCCNTMADISGRWTSHIFYGHIDCEEIGEQY